MDFETKLVADEVGLFSDASRAVVGKGFGCYFSEMGEWLSQVWDEHFILECEPSIQFLELYVLVVTVRLWGHHFKNRRIEIKCDNEGVVHMVNNSTSKCSRCMVLIRKLVTHCMKHQLRVFAKHLTTKDNAIADALLRNDLQRFWKLVPSTTKINPEPIPEDLWPIPKAWFQDS